MILGEPPTAITVEIVFAPPHFTTIESHRSVSVDEQSHEPVDAIDRLQTAAVEQQDEPPPVPVATTAISCNRDDGDAEAFIIHAEGGRTADILREAPKRAVGDSANAERTRCIRSPRWWASV